MALSLRVISFANFETEQTLILEQYNKILRLNLNSFPSKRRIELNKAIFIK